MFYQIMSDTVFNIFFVNLYFPELCVYRRRVDLLPGVLLCWSVTILPYIGGGRLSDPSFTFDRENSTPCGHHPE